MFGKNIPQSLIDAVKMVTEKKAEPQQLDEAGWDKEKTSTGTRVYGSSYGDSKKARKEQTKSSVDTTKGPTTKQLTGKNEDFKNRLLGSLTINEEEVDQQINEVLSKDASAGDWIHDFVHSDNPKFAGKSKAMRKKMALAAYYAKQRNEETEIEEELKGKQHKLDKNKNGRLDSDDFKKLRKEEKDDCECDDDKEEGHEDEKEDKALVKKLVKKDALKSEEIDPNVRTKDTTSGRKPTKQKDDVGPGSDSKSTKVKFHGGPMVAKEEAELDESTPPKGTDVADKSYLKTAGKKPGPLHNVGKGLKAFLKGKPEPMESVEVEGEELNERDEGKPGLMFKKIALKAGKKYGSKAAGERVAGAIRKKVLAKEGKQPEQGNVPFVPDVEQPANITDKSGAVHTPMSRAKDLARTAMAKIKNDLASKK